MYAFTKALGRSRKNLTHEELKENLLKLIEQSFEVQPQIISREEENVTPMLVGKRIQHKFASEESAEMYTGMVISQVQEYCLDMFLFDILKFVIHYVSVEHFI